ncbi:hypothetical protein BGZ76_000169 [Entomortierella beljakovae]|nr:hypothetical protein BGZ76_000169 [Entomortierella beljakovae]
MTEFTSIISKYAHENNGEGSSSNGSNGTTNGKKRSHTTNGIKEEDQEESSGELSTQVRKSLRLSATPSNPPLISRPISADSIKSRPHHKRPTPRGKTSRNPGYSAPEVYAHLALLPDIIDYDLDVLFVGINPGVMSSLLPPGVRLGPDDDYKLPRLCNMGLTNLVDRPSRMGNELSDAECRAAAPVLTAKIRKYRPRFVCFVSKQAWDMYAGVGLGLQTAWVSWYDEAEDDVLEGVKDGDDFGDGRSYETQNNLDTQGYRLAPYFERGPSYDNLESKLKAEGIVHPIKHEKSETKDPSIKKEPDDTMTGIKMEKQEDKKVDVQMEEEGESSNSGQFQSQADRSLETKYKKYKGGVRGSRMFVMPSTSGRVTQYKREDKTAYLKQLAGLVRKDRRMRGLKDPWEEQEV